mmetsp:Transcript_40795/g.46923  ORF Transcript_40795/g.46923 Transcript_40795/m.46923 type:complete len:115 (-) Transcript_40795:933-1277(-)
MPRLFSKKRIPFYFFRWNFPAVSLIQFYSIFHFQFTFDIYFRPSLTKLYGAVFGDAKTIPSQSELQTPEEVLILFLFFLSRSLMKYRRESAKGGMIFPEIEILDRSSFGKFLRH